MRSSPLLYPSWAAVFLTLITAPISVQAQQFQEFFPGWSDLISGILRDNCTAPLQLYRDDPGGQGKWRVVDCVFSAFTESRKAELAAAALTLGLAPTILQSVSASSTETSILFMRRPLLALLIAASSIASSNPRDNRYADPAVAMRQPVATTTRPWILARTSPALRALVSLTEYVLAGLAAGNVALLAYELGFWNLFAATNFVYDPTLLTYAALLLHFLGIIGLLLHVRVARDSSSEKSGWLRAWAWPVRWVRYELVPGGFGEPLLLEPLRPSVLSLAVSWILSIGPTLQVVYGTISLSGSLLMSQWDARNCLFRYFFSAVVARGILLYELAGIREASAASYASEPHEIQTDTGYRKGNEGRTEQLAGLTGTAHGYQLQSTPEIRSAS